MGQTSTVPTLPPGSPRRKPPQTPPPTPSDITQLQTVPLIGHCWTTVFRVYELKRRGESFRVRALVQEMPATANLDTEITYSVKEIEWDQCWRMLATEEARTSLLNMCSLVGSGCNRIRKASTHGYDHEDDWRDVVSAFSFLRATGAIEVQTCITTETCP